MQNMIDEVINEDVTWAKSSLELRNQRCYSVKVSSLLHMSSNQNDTTIIDTKFPTIVLIAL